MRIQKNIIPWTAKKEKKHMKYQNKIFQTDSEFQNFIYQNIKLLHHHHFYFLNLIAITEIAIQFFLQKN